MKLISKFHVAMTAIAITVVSAFAGTVSGTLAWYSYSTRSSLAYVGTSVNQSELLQIGLVCENDYWPNDEGHNYMYETHGLTYVYAANSHIYFAKPGSGLKSDVIKEYIAKTGYSATRLEPVTTREYVTGNDLTLYQPLVYTHRVNNSYAQSSQYSKIKFAFRVISNSMATASFVGGQKIWLSDATAQASGAGEISRAVRLFFDGTSSSGRKFILNPSDTGSSEVKMPVAGLLNLNPDKYYDFDEDGKEIIYGDYTIADGYEPTYLASDTAEVDMNNTGDGPQGTTFYAKHKGGKYVYANKTEFFNNVTPKTATYETFNMIKPLDDNGHLSGGNPLCITDVDSKIALLDLTIWLEGWDHSVINSEIRHKFNLGLEFQINRLD